VSRFAGLWLCATVLGAGQPSCTILRVYPPRVVVMVADGSIDNTQTTTTTKPQRPGLLNGLFSPDKHPCP